MGSLIVTLDGRDVELPEDRVHYLMRDQDRLEISPVPADDEPSRQLGYFVTILGRWFFHADNVPAARVLRIDGGPVTNVRQELHDGRPTVLGLASDVPAGPRRPRVPAARSHPPGPAGPGGAAARPQRPGRKEAPPRGARRYVIGRAGTGADIPVDDPLVRARHATVRIDGRGRWWISGELSVGGVRQLSATLSEGDVFVIGQTVVTVSRDLLPDPARVPTPPRAVRPVDAGARRRPTTETGLAIRLDRVTVHGDQGRKRLDDVSLDIAPGQVVAVVGPSGAGKSSLIKVLMGELAEDEGTVRLGPDGGGRTHPELRRRQVRYVPQGDEDLFPALTARETLTYAARLRSAPDTSAREVTDRVGDVLGRLGLDQPAALADLPVRKLSGGQRRRVSIGLELVGRPQLLLLDEPTSGLDPGKDRAIMADLRAVATTYHCTVVIVTHATEHLGFVDRVLVVARGGRIRDAGSPDRVLATLGHQSWADLMVELDREPPAGSGRPGGRSAPSPARAGSPARWRLAGLPTLLHRQLTLTRRRGWVSQAVLVGVPLLCTLLAVAASGTGLRPGAELGPVLAILVTVAALTGASLTYPDIVADSEKLRRDWRVGVEALPIVLSKAIVYSGVCAVLAAVVSVVFAELRELPPAGYGIPPFAMLYGIVLLTMLASMGLGMLISARSPTLERAVTWSTLLAVLQVALNGTLFELKGFFGLVTGVLPARLGLAAVASYVDFNRYRRPALFTDPFWTAGGGRFWLLTVAITGVFLLAVLGSVRALHRRWTR
ncbi:ATP-binding cassette domain-containing protein [Micromonospora sp. WMMD712]|uniref:ATP-binding cassette domain-containing protein n=1 Tax=Micromonospora sp. WMMD712 TaxID=3016096 RepID=UPI00249C5C19|nr:ATP-binding cassette domain-containing protein [Micromonospora sp. WMMD712]WFE59406.1 ATP-binding cassette domain-containing protein [Micromonospora sp. WMMD712]